MNADIILIPYFAEVIVGDKPEKVQAIQFSALRQLQARLRIYGRKILNTLPNKIRRKIPLTPFLLISISELCSFF